MGLPYLGLGLIMELIFTQILPAVWWIPHTHTHKKKEISSLRDVVKVESLRQLEVELDGGTLVRATKGVHYHNVNLMKIRHEYLKYKGQVRWCHNVETELHTCWGGHRNRKGGYGNIPLPHPPT